MTSKSVILGTSSKRRHQPSALGRPDGPMVQTHFLRKRPGLPTFHSCSDDRNMIHAPAFDGHISADLFEAFTPKQLARAGDVLDANESIVVGWTRAVLERRSDQPQSGILGQLPKQEGKGV